MAVTTNRETRIRRSAQPQGGQSSEDVSYYASRSLSGAAEVNRAPRTEQAPVQAPPAPGAETEQERPGHDISRLPITSDARDESGLSADPQQAAPDAKDAAKPAPEDAKPQNEQSVAGTTAETQASDKEDSQTVARSAAPETEAPAEESEEGAGAMPEVAAPEGSETEPEAA